MYIEKVWYCGDKNSICAAFHPLSWAWPLRTEITIVDNSEEEFNHSERLRVYHIQLLCVSIRFERWLWS